MPAVVPLSAVRLEDGRALSELQLHSARVAAEEAASARRSGGSGASKGGAGASAGAPEEPPSDLPRALLATDRVMMQEFIEGGIRVDDLSR